MKVMKDILHIPVEKHTKGNYGIEIEVEGMNLPAGDDMRRYPQKFNEHWNIDKDGSLKAMEAWEYIMPKPKNLEGVKKALDNMIGEFEQRNTVMHESVKAGVHVHMNVQDWDVKRLFTFACVYFILESILVKWCGPFREGNLFCLRGTRDAENVLFQLQEAVAARNLRLLNNDEFRYCSLNFCSLFKYGSLEFRSMRSTRDFDAIFTWVSIIDELARTSEVFRSPVDAIVSMSGDGEQAFLKRMLPSFADILTYDGYERDIRDGARSVQTLAFTVDWEDMGKPSNNPFQLEQF